MIIFSDLQHAQKEAWRSQGITSSCYCKQQRTADAEPSHVRGEDILAYLWFISFFFSFSSIFLTRNLFTFTISTSVPFGGSLRACSLSTEKRWYPITTYMSRQLICCKLFVPFMLVLELRMNNYDGEWLRGKVLLQPNFLWSCEWNGWLKLDSCDKWKFFR